MKQVMRDHLHAYGRVLGFLKRYRQLSDGMGEQEPSIDTFLAFDLPCSSCSYFCTRNCQRYHQGLWQRSMMPAKTGTGSIDVRSKRRPTISVLMVKGEEYLTP